MDKLEKVVADLKHLDGDELNKVWGFAPGLLACGLLIRPHENAPGNRGKEEVNKYV